MPTECLEYDATYFMALGIVSKEHLKTVLWGALKIAGRLSAHKADPAHSIKHECQVSQVPLAEGLHVAPRRLHKLR